MQDKTKPIHRRKEVQVLWRASLALILVALGFLRTLLKKEPNQ